MGEARRKKLLYGAPTKTPKKTKLDRDLDELEIQVRETWERTVREVGESMSWEELPLEQKEFLYVTALAAGGDLDGLIIARGFLEGAWPPGTLMERLRAPSSAPWTPGKIS